MLFKNITVFNCDMSAHIKSHGQIASKIANEFSKLKKIPIMDIEVSSVGWVSPTNDDLLVSLTSGILLFRLAIEKRSIPKSFIDKEVEVRAREFEKENTYAPGRVARKKMREEVIDEMTPRAFPVTKYVNVMVNIREKILMIDSATPSVVDEVIKYILKSGDTLPIQTVPFGKPLPSMFYEWVAEFTPDGFTFDDTLAMVTQTGKITYKDAKLVNEELGRQIASGSTITALAMTYEVHEADMLHFVLTTSGAFRSIKGSASLGSKITSNPDDFEANIVLAADAMTSLVKAVWSELDANKIETSADEDELV